MMTLLKFWRYEGDIFSKANLRLKELHSSFFIYLFMKNHFLFDFTVYCGSCDIIM